MRFVRVLAALAGLLVIAACGQGTSNSAGVWVRVSPTTVTAGYQTQIQASCGENANAATVTSPVFGSVTLQPVGGVLSTTVTVPSTTQKGTYDVRLSCPTGSQATTTLTVLASGSPAQGLGVRGPDTGGGFLARGGEAPADRTPLLWLGVGVGCLVAALLLWTRRAPRAVPRKALLRPRPPTRRH
jgi:hypothetical protein